MSEEKIYTDAEIFVREMKALGIEKIALAKTSERRAEQTGPDKLEVVVVKKAVLLAYRDSVLFKCEINDPDLDTLTASLKKDFDLTVRNRNIT